MKKYNFFAILSFLIILCVVLIVGTALSSCSINVKEVLKSLGTVTVENKKEKVMETEKVKELEKEERLEEEKKEEAKITEESGVEVT